MTESLVPSGEVAPERPSLRLIEGGLSARASRRPRSGSRRRRRAAPPPEMAPEDLADAALLLLTSVRGAGDARKVIERLSAEVDPETLDSVLEAVGARLALLARAAEARPRSI